MMRKFRFLVLLVVLGTFGSATAIAGNVDTPGQFKARQVIKSSEVFTPPPAPTFFVVGVGDFVTAGQPLAFQLVDLVLGENSFHICRVLQGQEAACFEPLPGMAWFVDQLPAQSVGKMVTYQIAKTDKHGTVLDWGFIHARVGFAPERESVLGTQFVKAEPFVVQCRPTPGMYCPMVWITEANYLRVTATGTYPAGSDIFVLATARDGSVAKQAVLVKSADGVAYSVAYVIPRITYRLSPVSLTEFDLSTRTFRTLVDVIPPVLPNGAGTADR